MKMILPLSCLENSSCRKTTLPQISRLAFEKQGWVFGDSLKVPGGYALKAVDPEGNEVKVGFKSAWYRCINTARTLVSKVDIVFVIAPVWDERDAITDLEIYKVPADRFLEMIDRVEQAKIEANKPDAHVYVPLDDARIPSMKKELGTMFGSLVTFTGAGDPIITAEIGWEKGLIWGKIEDTDEPVAVEDEINEEPKPLTLDNILADTKEDIAALLGYDVSKIKLQMTVEA